jgi:hypothetical protein
MILCCFLKRRSKKMEKKSNAVLLVKEPMRLEKKLQQVYKKGDSVSGVCKKMGVAATGDAIKRMRAALIAFGIALEGDLPVPWTKWAREDEDKFKKTISEATSLKDCSIKMGWTQGSQSNERIRRKAKELGIEISHLNQRKSQSGYLWDGWGEQKDCLFLAEARKTLDLRQIIVAMGDRPNQGNVRKYQRRAVALGINGLELVSSGETRKRGTWRWSEKQDRALIDGYKNSKSWCELSCVMGWGEEKDGIFRVQKRTIELNLETKHLGLRDGLRFWGREEEAFLKEKIHKAEGWASLIRMFGALETSSSYRRIKNKVAELALNTSHFVGQGHARSPKRLSREEWVKRDLRFFRAGKRPATSKIHEQLIAYKIKEKKCEECLRSKWEGRPIPLELHHINGDNRDHRLKNLKILCRNCHGLTETHGGRNVKKQKKIRLVIEREGVKWSDLPTDETALAEWSKKLGMKTRTLAARIRRARRTEREQVRSRESLDGVRSEK